MWFNEAVLYLKLSTVTTSSYFPSKYYNAFWHQLSIFSISSSIIEIVFIIFCFTHTAVSSSMRSKIPINIHILGLALKRLHKYFWRCLVVWELNTTFCVLQKRWWCIWPYGDNNIAIHSFCYPCRLNKLSIW